MSQTNIVITDGVTTHKDVLDVVNLNSVDAENRISTLETDGVGASAYEVAVNEGFVGDESAWLASLVGADGADGPTGDDGLNGVDGSNGIEFAFVQIFAFSNATAIGFPIPIPNERRSISIR